MEPPPPRLPATHHHHYRLSPPAHSSTHHLNHSSQTLHRSSQSLHHSTPNIHENKSVNHDSPSHASVSTICPRHGNNSIRNGSTEKKIVEQQQPSTVTKPKERDTKEIMKKRRERAICIVSSPTFEPSLWISLFSFLINMFFQDRVSRIVFPSTFVLLNITYWLAFSDIFISISDEDTYGH